MISSYKGGTIKGVSIGKNKVTKEIIDIKSKVDKIDIIDMTHQRFVKICLYTWFKTAKPQNMV